MLQRLVDPSLKEINAGYRQAAHLDLVRSLTTSGDGEWFASGGFRTVKLWRRETHLPKDFDLADLAMPQAIVSAQNWLAVGDNEGKIAIVRRDTPLDLGAQQTYRAHAASIVALAAVGQGSEILSVAADGSVRLSSAANGTKLAAWHLSVLPKHVALVADDLLVTSADDLVLRLWTLARPVEALQDTAAPVPIDPVYHLRGHGREVTVLARVPGNGRCFVSGSVDGSVRRWQWDGSAGTQTNHWIHGATVLSLAVSPDGSQIVSAGKDDRN